MQRRSFLQVALCGFASLLLWRKPAQARPAFYLPYEKLANQADFIVIARVTASQVVTEPFNYLNIEMLGVETFFAVVAVLKETKEVQANDQDKATKPARQSFILYHYRLADPATPIVDGPSLVHFDPNDKAQYLMFLKDSHDGRFEPLTTQYDADFSIEKLRFTSDN